MGWRRLRAPDDDEVEEVTPEEPEEPRMTLEEIQEVMHPSLRLGGLKRSREHIEGLSDVWEDAYWDAYLAEGRQAVLQQRQISQFLSPRSKRPRAYGD